MNNQLLKELDAAVQDKAETMRKMVDDWFSSMHYGTRELRSDEDFIAWYTMKAQDPFWVVAIRAWPEGRRWEERYMRLMGVSDDAAIG